LKTGESVTIANDPGDESTAVRPGSTITVTTRTENAYGQVVTADASDKVADVPDSSAPSSITDLTREPNVLGVGWSYKAPLFWKVEGFDVLYRRRGGGGDGTSLGSVGKNDRKYTHSSVIADGWYEVRVVVRAKYFGSAVTKSSAW